MMEENETMDFIENSTAPMWPAEERAAILYSEMERLTEAIARHSIARQCDHAPTSLLFAYDRACRLLKEINAA